MTQGTKEIPIDDSRANQLFACLADADKVILLPARLINLMRCHPWLLGFEHGEFHEVPIRTMEYLTMSNIDRTVHQRKKCMIICQARL